MDNAFVCNLYDETMRLMEDAREYHRHWERTDREALPLDEGCAMSRECLSMTARLTSVMAWVLTQRAVTAGELSPEEAVSGDNRLLADPIHLAPLEVAPDRLPSRLWRLLDSSYRLYSRVRRIESRMIAHAA